MQIIRNLDELPEELRAGAVSLGKFDGMHLGHVKTVRRLKSHAASRGVASVVVTFDPLPIQLLRPRQNLRTICTLARKLELIASLEPDAVIVLPTTLKLLEQSAETFFSDMFQSKLRAAVIVEGQNFNFGRNREGTVDTLREYGKRAGVEIDILDPVCVDGHIVSSSGIRALLQNGQVEQANALMPQAYRMTGVVVAGDRRGRTLGFPTANFGDVETMIPGPGLYATVTHVEGKKYASTTHVGPNRSFNATDSRIETFLHQFDGDLYGKNIDVDFHARLRDSIRFDSAEELVRQMHLDIQQSRQRTARLFSE